MPMPHQTDTIIWIPISEKLPPSGFVLASTKHSVHILQYRKGQPHVTHSDFWMDQLGKKSDIRVEDVALGQSCLALFGTAANRPQCPALQHAIARKKPHRAHR